MPQRFVPELLKRQGRSGTLVLLPLQLLAKWLRLGAGRSLPLGREQGGQLWPSVHGGLWEPRG